MIGQLNAPLSRVRRTFSVYGAIGASIPKVYLAYVWWVWIGLLTQVIASVIFVYFWRAVYAQNATIGGLDYGQTVNYVLLAQILLQPMTSTVIFDLGYEIRNGGVSVQLARPIDMQLSYYAQAIGWLVMGLLNQLPLLVLQLVFFGVHLPGNPLVWLAFIVSLMIGHAAVFCFDWIFSALAFFTTEVWGLGVLREGIAVFFGGGLIPIVLMPGWLQAIAGVLPFAQGLYVPVAILSGTVRLSATPHLILTQIAWLIVMLIGSRLFFRVAVRRVTVQGG